MKRISALLLAVFFCKFASVGVSHADGIDIKVKGQWDFAFGWSDNTRFVDNVHGDRGRRDDDNWIARHRIRTQINFITSEYLQGVLMFEIGNLDWGRANGNSGRSSGGALDADGVNIETKRAFLDWIIPNTEISVRMGIQGVKLPSTPMGSGIFDADVAGVVVSSPVTDWMSITGFWLRPFDAYSNDSDAGWGGDRHYDDETDIFGVILPFTGDGWSFSPWGMYSWVGANSGIYDYLFRGSSVNTVSAQNSHTKAWWAGAHLELTLLDPFVFNIDGAYGRINRADLDGLVAGPRTNYGTKGWFIAATLDYKLDWGTPGIFGWYGSGDDDDALDDGMLGRLPTLGTDQGFQATSFGMAGTCSIGTDSVVNITGTGTWGIGIKIADVSFIEDLSHTLRFAYYQGTNDHDLVKKNGGNSVLKYAADGLYLTDKDSVYEVNFDHTYKIYENLTAVLELGWLHLDADRGTWGRTGNKDETSDAWKAQVMFQYKF